MNPAITKREHLAIIVMVFGHLQLLPKSSILNVVGFLDPLLHCAKFPAKVVGLFKPKRMVMYTCIY